MCISRSGLSCSAIVENPSMSQNRMLAVMHLAVARLDRTFGARDVVRHFGSDEAAQVAGDGRVGDRLRQQPAGANDARWPARAVTSRMQRILSTSAPIRMRFEVM